MWDSLAMTPERFLLLGLLVACGKAVEPPSNIAQPEEETAEETEPLGPCPPDMLALDPGVYTLGEADPAELEPYTEDGQLTALPSYSATVGAVCVGLYPFPGEFGDPWPGDGLRYGQLGALEEALAKAGRRLCTVSELTLAAAGPESWRYPFDPVDYVAEVCDPDDGSPRDMGTYRDCLSPLGLSDFLVRSSWAVLDDAAHDVMLPYYNGRLPEEGYYTIYGGVSRRDTFYAPTNFGLHFHGADEEAYLDDGLRLCADQEAVGEEEQKAWRKLRQRFVEAGTFEGWLGG